MSLRREPLACLALVVMVLLVFGRVHSAGFLTYDDPQYVFRNPHVLGGLTWENVRWAFTGTHQSNWHPVTWLSHMLDCSLFGPVPGPHHLVNVGLHAANAVLLFLLLKEATRDFWPSLAVAALFAVHPVHVESVAWIAERKDVLSLFFALLALIAYGRHLRSGSKGALAAALVLYALGLMAKTMVVSLPFLMLAMDYWPLARMARPWGRCLLRRGLEKWPFALLALGASLLTLAAQGEAMSNLAVLPFRLRLANALVATLRYLGCALWPRNLTAFYPYLPYSRLPLLGALSLLGLAALSWAVVRYGRRHPYLVLGWTWYLVALLPVIGLVQVGAQSLADRYTYLPLIGPFAAAVWLAAEGVRRWRLPRAWVAAGAALLFGGLMLQAWSQTGLWQDDFTLFGQNLRVAGENGTARQCLGMACLDAGRGEEAVGHFRLAVADQPRLARTHLGLGEALRAVGRDEEAGRAYLDALALTPDDPILITRVVPILIKGEHLEAAAALLGRYLALEPQRLRGEQAPGFEAAGTRRARMLLGLVLDRLGRTADACAVFQAAAAAAPGDPDPLFHLGLGLRALGRPAEALRSLQRCAALAPRSAPAHLELGRELALAGRSAEAVREFQLALALDPASAEARRELGAGGR